MTADYRFLLDQNFPNPPFDPSMVDQRVEYVHVSRRDSSLTEGQTPDWLIYLRAEEDAFTGVVTRDASQLEQPEELVALIRTDVSVVTWKDPIEDPVQEWGQMLAYMPEVLKRLDELGPSIFYLPKPQLARGRNVTKASARLGEYAAAQQRSQQELRHEAFTIMNAELEERGLDRLKDLLHG